MIESAETVPPLDQVCVSPAPSQPAAQGVRPWAIPGLRWALAAALSTRVLIWVAARVTIAIFGQNAVARHVLDPEGVTSPWHSAALHTLLAPSARWDSVWYLQIAAHGYFKSASANFFPLYPMLIRLTTRAFGSAIVAGLAISAASLAVALTLLYRLALLELDEPAARMTVMLIAVFPTSLFFSAVYPTSLFLMLTIGAIYAARRDRWMVAATCGGLAAATRSNGILLVIPLALMYLYGPRGLAPRQTHPGTWWRPRFPVERDAAWLALVPAGLAGYLGYLLVAHGAPLAPYRVAHLYWDHSFGPPLGAIVNALARVPGDLTALISRTTTSIGPGDPISWQLRNLVDVLFLALALFGVALAWCRVPRVYVIYAVLQLVQVTSFPSGQEPMIGIGRYMLPMFALFLGAGAYLAKHRTAARITLGTSTVLLLLFSGLWGYWALVP